MSVTAPSQRTSADRNTARLTRLWHKARNNFAEGAAEAEQAASMWTELPACAGSRKIRYQESNEPARCSPKQLGGYPDVAIAAILAEERSERFHLRIS